MKEKIIGLVANGLIALTLCAATAIADTATPNWLAGKPDLVIYPERCAVYRWIFSEADKQTEGLASQEKLAKNRIINLANKLTKHHQSAPQDTYEAEIRYLIMGGTQPLHFEFRMKAEELDGLLAGGCDGN